MFARVAGLEVLGAVAAASAFSGVYNVVVITVEFVVLAVGAWLLIRSKQATQSISTAKDAQNLAGEWRESYLAERQAREDATQAAVDQRKLKHDALNEVAVLRGQTNLTAVMQALIEIQKTATKTAAVLDKIANHLDSPDGR